MNFPHNVSYLVNFYFGMIFLWNSGLAISSKDRNKEAAIFSLIIAIFSFSPIFLYFANKWWGW